MICFEVLDIASHHMKAVWYADEACCNFAENDSHN